MDREDRNLPETTPADREVFTARLIDARPKRTFFWKAKKLLTYSR
jgi:hypothetical protein